MRMDLPERGREWKDLVGFGHVRTHFDQAECLERLSGDLRQAYRRADRAEIS